MITNYTGTPATDSIPLLGIDTGNSIATFPFFAAPRVTPAHDMTTQTDPANLQQLPATTGGETARYLGCWLGNHQAKQSQFPR